MLQEKSMTDQRIRLLLVGDHAGDPQLIESLLSGARAVQYTWELASNLSVATDVLRTKPIDLVLLDLSLPNSDGLDSFRRLYPHAICLPIVILTDSKNDPSALQALGSGAQDYLVWEQIDAENLVQTLDRAIERKHAEIALQVKIRDLTALAQQLEQAGRIGHELNNSLATVRPHLERLLAQTLFDDSGYEDLEAVHDEVVKMARLVADLMQFSQKSPSKASKVDLAQEIKDTPDLLQFLREHKIVTVRHDETYFLQTPETGLGGYILKGASLNDLIALMHQVIQEGVMIPRTLGPHLMNHLWEEIKAIGVSRYEQLSPRERETLRLIARGRTNKEIAKRLSISVRTVERHRSSIMNKLGLQNRAELLAYAVQQGLLGGEDMK